MGLDVMRWGIGLLLALAASCSHALVFAVNEGVTYRVSNDEIRAKYTAIAADLSKLLKQPVTIEPVADYPTLRRGLAAKQYDLALVHPAHLSIAAIKNSGYRLLAVFMGDLKDSTLGMPDEDSITSWMTRATLRDALGDGLQTKFVYTRYQEAVPFFVENNLTKAGSTASASVVKAWLAKGGRVLGQSRPVPIKHVIASPNLPADLADKVRDYLLLLDSTDEGKKKLEATKYIGFAPYSQTDMISIGNWLGL